MDQILHGTVGGLAAAVYLTIFFATLRSKSLLGSLLFICLVLVQAMSSIFEISWWPGIASLTESWGLNFGAEATRTGILSIMISMLGGLAIAHFTGFIRYLSRRIDRFGAAFSARFTRPPDSTGPTNN
ncbi:hypothetical protein ACFY5D_03885 [Paeniglutamicibacter sp. NPDC012692]|uniref:hypothetical protein n=1 Tax=Paeniglutamicibacter sp. NPDC012692 TaxID=3364388 RepID=UPI0036946C4E